MIALPFQRYAPGVHPSPPLALPGAMASCLVACDLTQHVDPVVSLALQVRTSQDGGLTWQDAGACGGVPGGVYVDQAGQPIVALKLLTQWGIDLAPGAETPRWRGGWLNVLMQIQLHISGGAVRTSVTIESSPDLRAPLRREVRA